MNWDKLSMKDRASLIQMAVQEGITDLGTIRDTYNRYAQGGDLDEKDDTYSAGRTVDEIYKASDPEISPYSPSGYNPQHGYEVTIPEELADKLGYFPDPENRNHRDDRVKLKAHPTHPSRGTWNKDEFMLTDFGMEDPNYIRFGMVDNDQDPQAVITYDGNVVLPELTITPDLPYLYNSYDDQYFFFKRGGRLNKFLKGGPKETVVYVDPRTGVRYDTKPQGWHEIGIYDPNKDYSYLNGDVKSSGNSAGTPESETSTRLDDLYVLGNRDSQSDVPVAAGSYQDVLDYETKDMVSDPSMTEGNMFRRAQIAAEDARVRESAAFEKPMNFLSPGQWFDAGVKAWNGEFDDVGSFFKHIYDGNSGWVSDKFIQEYPRLGALFNFGLDMAVPTGIGYAKSGLKSYLSNPVNNPVKNFIELGTYSTRGAQHLTDAIGFALDGIKRNPKLFRDSLKYPFMKDSPKKSLISSQVQDFFDYNGLWGGNKNAVSQVGFNPIRAGLYGDFGIFQPYVRTVQPGDIHYQYAIDRGIPDMKVIDSPYEGSNVGNYLDLGEVKNSIGDIRLGELSDNTGYKLDAHGHMKRRNMDGNVQQSDAYKYNTKDYTERHGNRTPVMPLVKKAVMNPGKSAYIQLAGRVLERPLLKLLDSNFTDYIYQSKPRKVKHYDLSKDKPWITTKTKDAIIDYLNTIDLSKDYLSTIDFSNLTK